MGLRTGRTLWALVLSAAGGPFAFMIAAMLSCPLVLLFDGTDAATGHDVRGRARRGDGP